MKRWSVSLLAACLAGASLAACDEPMPEPPPPLPAEDDFHDPLSTPAEPTLSPSAFASAASCQPCHESHFAEWKTSMHAYAMVDPVFRALVKVRQQDFDGEQDQFCTQCHSAIGTRGGEIVDGFSFDQLSPIVLEGITCEACHKITDVQRPYNSGHVIDPTAPLYGGFATDAAPHGAAQTDLYAESVYCAGCHDVIEVSGLELERPYEEWLESPAFAAGTTCQSCHMPGREGSAGPGGPEREIHDHRFIGVDIPLSEDFVSDAERQIIRDGVVALLSTAASLELGGPTSVAAGSDADLLVTVTNDITGHNLPTGTTFIRELWVEVVATDALGEQVFVTGDLDENGDLRHHFSALDPYGDHDLLAFNATLVDAAGTPVIFPWRAAELISTAIPPLHARTRTLFIPTEGATSPIHVEARLRFRSHGPHLLRELGLDQLIDRLEIHDIATASTEIEIAPP